MIKEASDASINYHILHISCERYQLHMRAISGSKYTKIYSKGVLVSHTKISINEIFPLYGNNIIIIVYDELASWMVIIN